MTWFVASVSCKIPGLSSDKYRHMFFPSKNILILLINLDILAAVHLNLSWWTNNDHLTDLLQIAGWLLTPATCSIVLHDSFRVDRTNWLLVFPFWLHADDIFVRTSHFITWSSSSLLPPQRIVASQTPLQGMSRFDSSRKTCAWSNAPLSETQQKRRHWLVHHNAADTATGIRTYNANSKILQKTGSTKNEKHHAIGGEWIHIEVQGHLLTVESTDRVHWELPDQFIAAHNGNPPWATKSFACMVCDIEHHAVDAIQDFRKEIS